MFTEEMFLEAPTFDLAFEKTAATVRLPDNDKKWAPKILSELHRQVPAMESFHANIILDRVDANKGFGFGYIIAQPKVMNPLMAQTLPKVKIPVVIKNWHLSPLDVFYSQSGKGMPLTEKRIREALLRPDAFDVPTQDKSTHNQDIRNMLTPPWENVGQFYRGVNTQVSSGQVKTSSLLERLNGTVEHKDIVKLASWVKSKEGRAALYGNETIKTAMLKALRLETMDSIVKLSSAQTSPVVQFRWIGRNGENKVIIKTASYDAYEPEIEVIDLNDPATRADFMSIGGERLLEKLAQEDEQAMVDANQAQVLTPAEVEIDEFGPVMSFSVFKVITTANEQMTGWVFPYVVSYDMQKVPVQVFSDGTNYGMQTQIAGVHVGSGANLPHEAPQGRGMFYMHRNGRVFGFAPVEIMGQQQSEDGSTLIMCRTLLGGNDLQLQPVQGLRIATQMGEGVYGIPADARWLPFKQPVNPLVEDPAQATQRAGAYYLQQIQQAQAQAQAQQEQAQQQGKKGQTKKASLLAQVRMTRDGSYSVGGAPFEKLAAEQTDFIDLPDVEWLLALAGVDPEYTREKTANLAITGGYLEIPVFRHVTPPEYSVEKVAARREVTEPLKRFMAKHAATIGDPMVADSLLALNFLSPKNLTMFMSYLPQLDDAQNSLTNLLLSSRLGLQEIPEAACREAMKSLEEVIGGIKMLMLREAQL